MSGDAVWVNGVFGGSIDPRDRGLTLGDGVFDTLVAFRRVPFAGDKHLDRLSAQAEAIGIHIDPARVRAAWDAVLGRAGAEPIILRTTVTRGPSGRGLWPDAVSDPTLIVTATPWNARLFAAPVRLITSSITRDPGSPSSRLKTLGYLDNILAAREAAAQGADEALLLTPAGRVACTTIANVFAIRADRLITPPLADAVQPGIMRRLVLNAAEHAGLRPEESALTVASLRSADQVFLTNSVRFPCPCLALDGQGLASDAGEALVRLTGLICAGVQESCGFDPRQHFGNAS